MSKQGQDKKTVYRRIRGRIVPIAVSVSGLAVAADAARTRTVWQNKAKNLHIIRKRFTHTLPTYGNIGDTLILKKGRAVVGTANYLRNDKSEFAFGWLGVKKQFRGKGLSKHLSRQAVVEIKSKGGKSLYNNVIHERSLSTSFGRGRDSLWKMGKSNMSYRITKKEALSSINTLKSKGGYGVNVFRETNLTGVRLRRTLKPFMSSATKLKLAAGLGAAALGFSMFRSER